MAWHRYSVVFILLAAMLFPCRALGVELAIRAAPADRDGSSESALDSSVYAFPSAKEQFRLWAMNAAGPSAIAANLASASWRHWVTDEPEEWDSDGRGFAQRFGTASATTFVTETSLSLASAALHQDAIYYRCPRGGFGSRVKHATAMSFMARDRQGNAVFSPGKTLAPFVGPLVTVTTLYPEGYSYGDALLSGAYSLLVNVAWNAAREFVIGAPPWRSGRPPAW